MATMKIRFVGALGAATLGFAWAGCGGTAAREGADDAAPVPVPTAEARLPVQPPASPTVSAVDISRRNREDLCIGEPDAYFAFDSANVRPDDKRVLDLVITCFSTGPLKGRETFEARWGTRSARRERVQHDLWSVARRRGESLHRRSRLGSLESGKHVPRRHGRRRFG